MRQLATGKYGGVSAEERTADRRRRLMDAALEVVGTGGWSAATLRRVTSGAGVAPRYFYESFGSMVELVAAVHDELSVKVLDGAIRAIEQAPDALSAKSFAAVESVVRDITDDPRVARLLLSDAPPLLARKRFVMRSAATPARDVRSEPLIADFEAWDRVGDPLAEAVLREIRRHRLTRSDPPSAASWPQAAAIS